MNKILASTIAACAMIGVAATPAAASPYSRAIAEAKERVDTSDIDLSSADGRAELEQRITKAVKRECRYDVRGQIRKMKDERACRAAANKKLAADFALADGKEALGG